MKKILFTYILYIVSIICQSQTITPNVLVSAGGGFTDENVQVFWTLGDLQTDTYLESDLILTQGFLQSSFSITGILNLEETSDIKIKVFPNPVKDILNIQIQSKESPCIKWELINQSGKIIETSHFSNNSISAQINFSSFENGVYFIRTYNKDGSYIKIFKVVYLN